MGLRANQNISENTGRRIKKVGRWLRELGDMRNKPIGQLKDFIRENRNASKQFLHNDIKRVRKTRAVLFEYEYLYTLSFDSNRVESKPPPEHGLIGRKSIRVEIDVLGLWLTVE
jgi:hypothetical protein